jgi:hypothetical protein
MSDMRVDSSLQKKIEKTTNQHAPIPHFGKAGTPGYYRLSVKTKIKVLLDSSNIKKSISFAITISIGR